MSACPQCGTVVKPGDKFCNVCGAPIPRTNAPSAAAPAESPQAALPLFAAPSPGPGGPGGYVQGSSPARCQLGHEIAAGASYCAQGHPIALDQIPFANEGYGGGYAPPPVGQPPGGFRQSAQAAQPSPPFPTPGQGYGPPNQAAYAAAFGAPAFPPLASPYPGGPPQPPYNPPQPSYNPPPPYSPPPLPYAPAPSPVFAAEPPRDAAPARALRGFLVAYGANPVGDFWPLTGGRHAVGRFGTGDGLDIPLQDPTISSRHAALLVDSASGTIAIEDTGSTNGTFVNDEHIGYGGRRDLRDGDRLRFGGFTTIVKVIGRV